MAVSEINIPEKKQSGSIGRRLVGAAAPIVGGIFGGPAGAAAGAAIGSKLNGGSNQDALMSGISSAASPGVAGAAPAVAGATGMALDGSKSLQMPQLGDSAIGRRAAIKSQDPQMALAGGLDALSQLPQQHPFRQAYTEPLVRAQMMAKKGIA